MKPEWIVCGRNGLEIVIYRAPRPRPVWGRALLLTVAIWVLAFMALAHGAEPSWLKPAQYQSISPPASAPIVPATTCPPNQELYFSRCRDDCRFSVCMRRRLAEAQPQRPMPVPAAPSGACPSGYSSSASGMCTPLPGTRDRAFSTPSEGCPVGWSYSPTSRTCRETGR
jgi:hypothetical protein